MKVLDYKHKLEGLGFQCVPCGPKSKECHFSGWPQKAFADADFAPDANIAVKLGEKFTDVDCDCDEAVALAPFLLPTSPCSWGRPGRPRSHWLYDCHLLHALRFQCDGMLLEVRTGKLLTLAPGSVHPSGQLIEFHEDGAPSVVDLADLLLRCGVLAVSVLAAREVWGKGNHHGPALGLAGVFVKANIPIALARSAIQGLATLASSADINNLLHCVEDTYKRHADGQPISGIKNLIDAGLSKKAADAISKWLPHYQDVPNDTFGKPDETLIKEQQPAPAFPLSALGAAAKWVGLAADGANAPVDFTAGALLAAFSTVLANVRRVKIRSEWIEAPIIWCIQVGPPSSGKTPATKPILTCMTAIEAKWDEAHRAKVQSQIDDLLGQAAKADASAKKDIERDIDCLRDQLECAPRCMAMDSTIEALARIQRRSPRGLLMYADELNGLISNLTRYSNGSDRTYYVQSWNGGPYRVDRRKIGSSLYLPHHSLAIMGGIQPDVLESTLIEGKNDDGFLARFLIFAPSSLPAYASAAGQPVAPLMKALTRLASLPLLQDDLPFDIPMEAAAQNAFEAWAGGDHQRALNAKGMLGSAYGKFRGYCARLALVLFFLDWAWSEEEGHPVSIDEAHVMAAITLIDDYFAPQARRLYAAADWTPEERLARALLKEIRKRKESEFNARNAFRSWSVPGASAHGPTRLRDAALKILLEGGWIAPKQPDGPGRPPSIYVVNPALWKLS